MQPINKPCIVGCAKLNVDAAAHCAQLTGIILKEGDWLSIDGNAGEVYLGHGKVVFDRSEAELSEIQRWRNAAA